MIPVYITCQNPDRCNLHNPYPCPHLVHTPAIHYRSVSRLCHHLQGTWQFLQLTENPQNQQFRVCIFLDRRNWSLTNLDSTINVKVNRFLWLAVLGILSLAALKFLENLTLHCLDLLFVLPASSSESTSFMSRFAYYCRGHGEVQLAFTSYREGES
jgi:hypothetical protein